MCIMSEHKLFEHSWPPNSTGIIYNVPGTHERVSKKNMNIMLINVISSLSSLMSTMKQKQKKNKQVTDASSGS